jgi:hypothetical protein
MGFLAGDNQDNTASLIPNEVHHGLVVSQAHLQAAQMEKQVIDLEEENKHRSKKQRPVCMMMERNLMKVGMNLVETVPVVATSSRVMVGS